MYRVFRKVDIEGCYKVYMKVQSALYLGVSQ